MAATSVHPNTPNLPCAPALPLLTPQCATALGLCVKTVRVADVAAEASARARRGLKGPTASGGKGEGASGLGGGLVDLSPFVLCEIALGRSPPPRTAGDAGDSGGNGASCEHWPALARAYLAHLGRELEGTMS